MLFTNKQTTFKETNKETDKRQRLHNLRGDFVLENLL